MDPRDSIEETTAEESRRLIVIGRIGRVHGVQGWVRLHSYTDPRDALLSYGDCFLRSTGEWRAARFADGRAQGRTLIARFDGVFDRDDAARLTGADIGVRRDDLPDAEAGRYYWADLEGLAVRQRDGRSLGEVSYLIATGANDVLVVRGERETLIPFIMNDVILEVDLTAGVISVDWEWD